MSNTFFAKDDLETKEIARHFGRGLNGKGIVCLVGDLGAGKTTFVKGIADSLGIEEALVTSPTFTYLNLFEGLAHFDLYRLKNAGEFLSMGFDEYFDGTKMVCIEWPEIIEAIVPRLHYRISLTHQNGGRLIEIKKI